MQGKIKNMFKSGLLAVLLNSSFLFSGIPDKILDTLSIVQTQNNKH